MFKTKHTPLKRLFKLCKKIKKLTQGKLKVMHSPVPAPAQEKTA